MAEDEPKKAVKSEPKYVDYVVSENRTTIAWDEKTDFHAVISFSDPNTPEIAQNSLKTPEISSSSVFSKENLALIREAIKDCQTGGYCK